MALPPLTSTGDLPHGVHRATLTEVIQRFSSNRQRRAIANRLERVCRIARSSGHLARFIVFGSFITEKPHPNDVDVFMIMEDSFDASTLQGDAAILFDHVSADAHFGASVFGCAGLPLWAARKRR